jgi:xanthine/CO dehydrogenase XdhC/CoxF family maturation factor
MKGMVETRKIVELWKSAPAAVLVTLVRAEGSSYRRPGARLLCAGAEHAGTISGGCLEADVIRRAPWIAREQAAVERYATTFDDTAEIPYGLGCGGTVDLLFEPVTTPEGEALMKAMAGALGGREATVVSFLPDAQRSLRRLIFDDAGEVIFASEALNAEKIECARRLVPGEVYEGRFVERLRAPQRLFVLGAGDDAQPLVEMAALLGWSTVVADGRAQLAQTQRFPAAGGVVRLAGENGFGLDIQPNDAVIIMTHSYEQDRDLLVRVLPLSPRYLGLLGSRHRSSLLVSEAAAILGVTVESCTERLFAPVGMDLGGDGPQAIALAIVAEVQAACHGRAGLPRRLSASDIAEYVAKGGASRFLQAQCALDAS